MKITVIELSVQELEELIAPIPVRSISIAERPDVPTKVIREWARSKGIAVAKGGTLPHDVIDMYYEDQVISDGR